jgi:hypothetical protein
VVVVVVVVRLDEVLCFLCELGTGALQLRLGGGRRSWYSIAPHARKMTPMLAHFCHSSELKSWSLLVILG